MFHSPFFISLKIALLATLLVFISGLFLAYKSLHWKKARKIMDIIFFAADGIASYSDWILLAAVFSKQYPFGQFFRQCGNTNHI